MNTRIVIDNLMRYVSEKYNSDGLTWFIKNTNQLDSPLPKQQVVSMPMNKEQAEMTLALIQANEPKENRDAYSIEESASEKTKFRIYIDDAKLKTRQIASYASANTVRASSNLNRINTASLFNRMNRNVPKLAETLPQPIDLTLSTTHNAPKPVTTMAKPSTRLGDNNQSLLQNSSAPIFNETPSSNLQSDLSKNNTSKILFNRSSQINSASETIPSISQPSQILENLTSLEKNNQILPNSFYPPITTTNTNLKSDSRRKKASKASEKTRYWYQVSWLPGYVIHKDQELDSNNEKNSVKKTKNSAQSILFSLRMKLPDKEKQDCLIFKTSYFTFIKKENFDKLISLKKLSSRSVVDEISKDQLQEDLENLLIDDIDSFYFHKKANFTEINAIRRTPAFKAAFERLRSKPTVAIANAESLNTTQNQSESVEILPNLSTQISNEFEIDNNWWQSFLNSDLSTPEFPQTSQLAHEVSPDTEFNTTSSTLEEMEQSLLGKIYTQNNFESFLHFEPPNNLKHNLETPMNSERPSKRGRGN